MMAFEQDVIALRRDVDNLIKNQGNAGTITPEQILNALLTIDGVDSDLDADKLDGHHYSEILSLINAKLDSSAYTASDILSKLLTVDGSGSGLDSDKLDGHEYTDITTLISSKLDSSSYTAADILSKLLTVDGSGSGIDADKLDGYEYQDILDLIESNMGSGGAFIPSGTQIKHLIEEKNVSAITSTTFSNLNGDVDGEYIIEIDGSIAATGDSILSVRPNGLTTGMNSIDNRSYNTNGDVTNHTDRFVFLRHGVNGYTTDCYGKIHLIVKTGRYRSYFGETITSHDGTTLRNKINGTLSNKTTNITNLVIECSNGAYTGKIRLYKVYTTTSEEIETSTYNANDVLNKLLSVDGSGCGLDADKLDGKEAVDFISKTSLGSNINLNNIDSAGVYIQPYNSNATLALNYPIANAGVLEVFKVTGSDWLMQRYTQYMGTHMWIRTYTYSNTTWSAWSQKW